MSIRIMKQVWEHPHLHNATEKFVLLYLADATRDENDLCWPTIATIAAKCCLSTNATSAIINRLQSAGYLTIDVRRGRGASNIFHLHVNEGGKVRRPAKHTAGEGVLDNENEAETEAKTPAVKPLSQNPLLENPFSENTFSGEGSYKENRKLIKPEDIKERAVSANGHQIFDIDNFADPRYHSQHYKILVAACGLTDAGLARDVRRRARVAALADDISKTHSAEQMREARRRWPHPTPPTEKHFASEIDRLLAVNEVAPNERPPNPNSRASQRERHDNAIDQRIAEAVASLDAT